MVVDKKVRDGTSEHPWSKDHLTKSVKAKIMHTSRDETRYKVEFWIHLQDKHSSSPFYVLKVFCKLPWENLFCPVLLFLSILLTRKGREKMGVDYWWSSVNSILFLSYCPVFLNNFNATKVYKYQNRKFMLHDNFSFHNFSMVTSK